MSKLSRRNFIIRSASGLVSAALPVSLLFSNCKRSEVELPHPTPAQLLWQDLELGLAYHFDLDVYMPGGHHHERSRKELFDPSLYNPEKLDTDQWLEAAKACGARYAFFTATHHQGFLQWQSDIYPFGLKNISWKDGKADIVEEFVNSCAKFGIKPAIYIGIRFNAYMQVYDYKVNWGKGGDENKQAAYRTICEKIVEELVSRYGEFVEVWFDGGIPSPEQGGPDVVQIVQKYQDKIVYYHSDQLREHRWAGNEDGIAPYPCWSTVPDMTSKDCHAGDPDGNIWMPAFADTPIRDHEWLWVPDTEKDLISLDRLTDMYYQSIGRNANLVIGAVPDRNGLIPEVDMIRYRELGDIIRKRFSNKIGSVHGTGEKINLNLNKPAEINQIVIMEDLSKGERIRRYKVEGFVNNEWQLLCKGISVGHKRIQIISTIKTDRIRLICDEFRENPVVREFSVYLV